MRKNNRQSTFHDVVRDTRTMYDGPWTIKVVNFVDDYDLEMIALQTHIDDDVPHKLNIFENDRDEATQSIALKDANYMASPLRVTKNVSANKVAGLKPSTDSIENVPSVADSVLKMFGWTVVPDTDEWRDE